jgi:hypothetical protein
MGKVPGSEALNGRGGLFCLEPLRGLLSQTFSHWESHRVMQASNSFEGRGEPRLAKDDGQES